MRPVITLLRFESYDIRPGQYSAIVLRIKIFGLISTLLRFESYDNLLRLATTLIHF